MAKTKQYHGWIYVEKSEHYKDIFSTHITKSGGALVRIWGSGAEGAAKAVDYFETELALGSVKLERTPIGLRVFTEGMPKVRGK